jgi:ATP-dependent helicase/nuclease subunit A
MNIDLELNSYQQKALDTKRDIIVAAGAGSGKTRVLVSRYISLFLADSDLKIDNVVAITFTEKAAAELRNRVDAAFRHHLTQSKEPEIQKRLVTLLEELSLAWIGTIHGFCSRIIREFPLEAGVDADFSILDEYDSFRIICDSIEDTIYRIARDRASPLAGELRFLLRHLEGNRLRDILIGLFYHRDIASSHVNRYETESEENLLKRERRAVAALDPDKDFNEALQRIHARCLKALAHIYITVCKEVDLRKGFGTSLDFDDLLIRAEDLLKNSSTVREKLQRRFRYILVDEFQDTDPLQWRLFRILTETSTPGSLFLVGDSMQSIYGFRRADVRLFSKAVEYVQTKNTAAHTEKIPIIGELEKIASEKSVRLGLLHLPINYRSLPVIIDFANFFFSKIMTPGENKKSFEVAYEPLIGSRDKEPGLIEIFYADPKQLPENDPDSRLPKEEYEGEMIARRIRQLLDENFSPHFNAGEIAILLRARTHLKSYESALMRHRIPFLTVGGSGFFERQEILDMANLLQFLVSPENDSALLGLLRSPFMLIPDDLLFRASDREGACLWDRIRAAAHNADTIKDDERARLSWIVETLEYFLARAQRIPLPILLEDFLTKTDGWKILAAGPEGKRNRENLDKFLSWAREFDASGFNSLIDFTEHFKIMVENAEREGEAPLYFEEVNAVKIMTIHKAKGLEFPAVFLPGISSHFRLYDDPFIIDEQFGLAMKLADPSQLFATSDTALYSVLKEMEKDKIISEEKRLFYVGVTRAMRFLALSLTPVDKRAATRQSRRLLLNGVFKEIGSLPEVKKIQFTQNSRTWTIKIHNSLPLPPSNKENEMGKKESIFSTDALASPPTSILPITAKISPRRFMVTQLMEFERCPLKYYLTRLVGWTEQMLKEVGVPSTFGVEEDRPEISLRLIRGSVIHALLEKYPFPPEMKPEDIVISLLGQEAALSPDEKNALQSDILRAWAELVTKPFIQRLIACQERRAELPFQIQFGDDILAGRVDACVKNEKGEWMVIDFKTGHAPDEGAAKDSLRYQIQMDAYGLFLSRFAPHQGKWQVHIYYTESDTLETRIYDNEKLQVVQGELLRIMDGEKQFRGKYASEVSQYGKEMMLEIIENYCCPERDNAPQKCPLVSALKILTY